MENIVNILFEWLHLQKIKHEWYKLCWVENPDSVAEHSLSAAQIWFILAEMEWVDPYKVASILIWHDFHETRIWDLHRVAGKYIKNKREIETEIGNDQFENIPWWDKIKLLNEDLINRSNIESRIAKDADYLQQAIQSKYYSDIGYKNTDEIINNTYKALYSESAKKIHQQIQKTNFANWWKWTWLKNEDV